MESRCGPGANRLGGDPHREGSIPPAPPHHGGCMACQPEAPKRAKLAPPHLLDITAKDSAMQGRPMLPPKSAVDMYRRNHRPIKWTAQTKQLVSAEYRELKSRWKFDPKPDLEWDRAETFRLGTGGRAITGNCNDFAPGLKHELVDCGLPENALRLAVCKYRGEGHMVLFLDTDQGVQVACNISGVFPFDSPTWRENYDLWHAEAPGRAWEDYRPSPAVGLADAIKGKSNA